MIDDHNLKGEIGFMLTQLEIAIKYVEIMDKNYTQIEDFDN